MHKADGLSGIAESGRRGGREAGVLENGRDVLRKMVARLGKLGVNSTSATKMVLADMDYNVC